MTDGEPLWSPSRETVESSHLARYLRVPGRDFTSSEAPLERSTANAATLVSLFAPSLVAESAARSRPAVR